MNIRIMTIKARAGEGKTKVTKLYVTRYEFNDYGLIIYNEIAKSEIFIKGCDILEFKVEPEDFMEE